MTGLPEAVQQIDFCAAPPVGVYFSSLDIPSRVLGLLVARRETLRRGTGISRVLLTRRAANALVLG
jgi:hypothetical protein